MSRPAHQIGVTIPVLETGRLILREPREADFAAMLAFNDSPRSTFVGGGRDRQWVWRGLLANIGHWALRGYGLFSVDTRAGDFIGRIGVIYHDGWDEPELGWHLFDGFEGHGYAVEAARAAKADYHARHTSAPLISYIDPANRKSEALAGVLGATPERETVFLDKTVRVWRHSGPDSPRPIRVDERSGATGDADFDGSRVRIRRPVARAGVSTRVETQGRRKEDAIKTSKRGD